MNFSKSYSNIFQSPYESQVMQLIGLIGLLRVLLAVIQDFLEPVLRTVEVLTDLGILMIFVTICLFALRLKASNISLSFGVILVVLLALNFLQFGGVTGFTEFNYLIGIVLMVLLYSEERKFILVASMLVLLALMLWLVYINHPIYQYFFLREQANSEDFVYSLVSLSILTLYLKYAMDLERSLLLQQQVNLNTGLDQSRELQSALQDQQAQLLHAQQKLAQEVDSRTKVLQSQNLSIEQYIQYNTTELKEPLARLNESLAHLKESGMLIDLLRISVAELETVTHTITHSLENEHLSNQSKIK